MIELKEIREYFRKLSPDELILDIENPETMPPPEIQFNKSATNLAEHYETINDFNLTDKTVENVEAIIEDGGTIEVISYHGLPPVY